MGKSAVILMTDFGLKERFVASMKGVIFSIDPEIPIFDLTHDITAFNIREASETLMATLPYWPEKSVFVSVVDPGVGTRRNSIAVITKDQKIVITPDNGTITGLLEAQMIEEIRIINESRHRLPGSEKFHTFHGRDIYAYNGARIASGIISFPKIGNIHRQPVRLTEAQPGVEGKKITGRIIRIEQPYGNLVTNISENFLTKHGIALSTEELASITIIHQDRIVFQDNLPILKSFGYARKHEALIYLDSVQKLGLALNQGNFAEQFGVKAGDDWKIVIGFN